MPDASPLISIITPAFRAEGTILRAVRSTLAQTYPHWEMLIVSDDETDYESFLAENSIHDKRLRFFETGQTGSGPNLARNVALEQARGSYIAPLDADDLYYSERLEKLLPLASSYGMSADNIAIIDEIGNKEMRTLVPETDAIRWLTMTMYAHTCIPMIFLFRRDIITAPWDEDVELGADTLFNLRAMERLDMVPFVERVMHEYHVTANSICHAANAHDRAERAYTYCLDKITHTGMGFRTLRGMRIVEDMLLTKRDLNGHYAESLANGDCSNFQEFIATKRNLGIDLYTSLAREVG